MIAGAERPLTKAERLRGLLLGGAVGDALGAPVEFLSRAEILQRFGPDGVTAFAPAYGRLGAITDDTQMTLFTAEAMIRAFIRACERGLCNPTAVIARAYRRWYATQTQPMTKTKELDGWLLGVPELWSRRAPEKTCLCALAEKRALTDRARNRSKGSGAIMRVGPIGLMDPVDCYGLACGAANLTHGHPTGVAAAGWFASMIGLIAEGRPVQAAARGAFRRNKGRAPELDRAIESAFGLAGRHTGEVPKVLGGGWVAEDAAAIALWCVLTAEKPLQALQLAVNIDGDSDTTGSLVGQILGAALGDEWIPRAWLVELELEGVIQQLAADAEASVFAREAGLEGPLGPFFERYPPW